MALSLGKTAAVTVSATLILICSCEKHHPGEYPEVQREKGAEASPAAEANEANPGASPAEAAKPSVTPTPAEFFPTKPR
jgi:hypothetical protein